MPYDILGGLIQPGDITCLGIIILVVALLICLLMFKEIMFALKKKKGLEKFSEVSSQLAGSGFQKLPVQSEQVYNLKQTLRTFERLNIPNISFEIYQCNYKKEEHFEIYTYLYKWQKKNEFTGTDSEGRQTRSVKLQKKLYTAVYIPTPVRVSEAVCIRCRLDMETEARIEYEEGMETPPTVGIPEFDKMFVCKGKDSGETATIATKQMQSLMLQNMGSAPLNEQYCNKVRMVFGPQGVNVTVEEVPDYKGVMEMVELGKKLADQTGR